MSIFNIKDVEFGISEHDELSDVENKKKAHKDIINFESMIMGATK